MANFDELPGGRLKKFRNRQRRCNCGKRRKGRPRTGYGVCHGWAVNKWRHIRHKDREHLSRALVELRVDLEGLEDLDHFHNPYGRWW